jgi:molecular chaperone DnaK (HSP70)
MLAIDIGSTRIKCARRVAGALEPEPLVFDGVPWLASHAHVRRSSGAVVFGSAALLLSERDPAAAVEGEVLAQCAQMGSMRVAGRTIDARELLGALLRHIRQQIAAAAHGGVVAPFDDLVIAVPLGANEAVHAVFRAAASDVGLDASRVAFAPEALAAARGGLPPEFRAPPCLIVVDCGGRTTRWAWLRLAPSGYVLDASVRPERLADTGMCTADLEILDRLLEADGGGDVLSAGDQMFVLQEIGAAREALGGADRTVVVQLRERAFALEGAQIRRAVRARVIDPLLAAFERFLNAVRLHSTEPPLIMLSGGGAGDAGIRQAFEELGVPVLASPYADRAVVRGALHSAADEAPKAAAPPATMPVTGSNRSRGERMEG